MWEIDINNQLLTFLLSIILGVVFCAFYDVFRALRKAGLNSFIATFIADIIYWIIIAFLTFLFLLARTGGEIRGYVLIAALIGFIVFRVTLSKLLFKFLSFIFCKTVKLLKQIHNVFYGFYDRFSVFLAKVSGKFAKSSKRGLKNLKKLLKYRYNMLYTKKNSKTSRKGEG